METRLHEIMSMDDNASRRGKGVYVPAEGEEEGPKENLWNLVGDREEAGHTELWDSDGQI